MRYTVGRLLLGLIALANVHESLGRPIPSALSGAVSVYKYEGSYHARGVPVIPIRIGTGVKGGKGGKGGKDGEGAGNKSPDGDKAENDSPVRIGTPGNSPDGEDDGSPVRIGTPDKTPDREGDGKPSHIGAGDKTKDVDLWCRSPGCGGSDDSTPSPTLTTQEKTDLSVRGDKGIELVSNPEKNKVDYSKRIKENYAIKEDPDVEYLGDSVGKLDFDTRYGFDLENGWKTYDVQSRGNALEPVVKMSIGTTKKDDNKYLAIVAHERFAKRDANRYKLNPSKDNVKNPDGSFVENPDKDSKAVPVSQLVYEAAQRSKMLQPNAKPEKVFLISENIKNDQYKKAIAEAHTALGKTGQTLTLRKDAPGPEGEYFRILAGTDNNYSFLNTVGRNPDFFKDYRVISIETREDPPVMNMELSRE